MKTEIIKTKQVNDADRKALFALFEQFYVNTNYENFCADFAEKHWLIRMTDGPRTIGFSTQQLIRLTVDKQNVRFLFSGDTIVHPDYWNKSHLSGAFGHLFQKIEKEETTPLYWFLITKGFRTYRFLPVFFSSFYPVFTDAHQELKPLLDTVAQHKFDGHYYPETECIDSEPEKDRLCPLLAHIPENRLTDPHIAFFLQRNPNFRIGTELACLAPLSTSNLTRCGKRVIQTTEVEWHA